MFKLFYKDSNLKFKLFCKESNLKGQNIEIQHNFCKESNLKSKHSNYFAWSQTSKLKILEIRHNFCKESNLRSKYSNYFHINFHMNLHINFQIKGCIEVLNISKMSDRCPFLKHKIHQIQIHSLWITRNFSQSIRFCRLKFFGVIKF